LSKGFATVDAGTVGAVIVSDAGTNDVDVYTTTGKLTATITGFSEPQGLAMAPDPAGLLYVADTANSNILAYKRDYKTLAATLNDSGQFPAGVAYDYTNSIVGVTNIISTAGGPGSVSFYKKGATTPCVTVANSDWARVYFGAFDDTGNFYIDGEDPNGLVLVGEVTGECKAKAITTLTTANAISFPGGIQVTKEDKIAIDDQLGAAIYSYNPPVGGALGSPIATTPLTGSSDPVTVALTKYNEHVWTADAGLASSLEFAFPAGGSPSQTISGLVQPIGVALTPVALP